MKLKKIPVTIKKKVYVHTMPGTEIRNKIKFKKTLKLVFKFING